MHKDSIKVLILKKISESQFKLIIDLIHDNLDNYKSAKFPLGIRFTGNRM